jgi:hypothetical protein
VLIKNLKIVLPVPSEAEGLFPVTVKVNEAGNRKAISLSNSG